MRSRIIPPAILTAVAILTLLAVTGFAAEKWQGVDEAVVKKIAKEHGREASEPVVSIDHGDLPLFLFLLAGAAGGFTAGYYWRKLIENRRAETEKGKQRDGTA